MDWTSVKDGLPDKLVRVLVHDYWLDNEYIAEWDGKCWYSESMEFEDPENDDITYWRDIPEFKQPPTGHCATDCECHGKREGDPYP